MKFYFLFVVIIGGFSHVFSQGNGPAAPNANTTEATKITTINRTLSTSSISSVKPLNITVTVNNSTNPPTTVINSPSVDKNKSSSLKSNETSKEVSSVVSTGNVDKVTSIAQTENAEKTDNGGAEEDKDRDEEGQDEDKDAAVGKNIGNPKVSKDNLPNPVGQEQKKPNDDDNDDDNKSSNDKELKTDTNRLLEVDEPENSHFMRYFLIVCVLVAVSYVAFYKRKKIMAYLIEGKRRAGSERKGVRYRKLRDGSSADDETGVSKGNVIY